MARWLESTAEKRADTDSVEGHTADRHFPWLELENQLESREHRVHIHIHGDTPETTHYPHRLPENTANK